MIRVGVAGWSYPDWRGTVYPSRQERGFDPLAYLSRYVDVVEINTTFYRPADPHLVSSWVRRTGERSSFRFTAKAHRSWTHDPRSDPEEVVPETLSGLAPLRDAHALGAILVQFPHSFHRTPAAFERLSRLLDLLHDWPVVVEVRHASWDDDAAAEWFRSRSVGWCVVDQPIAGASSIAPRDRVTSNVAYLRLHGRNVENWFREDAGRDARYDYLYSPDEIAPLARTAAAMARVAEEVFVVQNNHFRGQALVNALQIKHLVGDEQPDAPETLVDAYPELRSIVKTESRRLL